MNQVDSFNIRFDKMIKEAIKQAVDKASEKIIEEAKIELEKEIKSSLGQIALGVLKEYDIVMDRTCLRITIKNDVEVK